MRRLFIIRKDLHLSTGKLLAMVGHLCEAYWTNILRKCCEDRPVSVCNGKVNLLVSIDEKVWFDYALGIFKKTICECKNLNHLTKIQSVIDELNNEGVRLVENVDYGYINDACLTELTPENPDGTTTVGIWFAPLPDEVSKRLSKKYVLYGHFG